MATEATCFNHSLVHWDLKLEGYCSWWRVSVGLGVFFFKFFSPYFDYLHDYPGFWHLPFFFFLASKYPGKLGHWGRYYSNSDSSLVTVSIMCLNYILPVWRKVNVIWFIFICGLFCFKISTASMLDRLMLDVGPGSSYLFGLIWANSQILLPDHSPGTCVPRSLSNFLLSSWEIR